MLALATCLLAGLGGLVGGVPGLAVAFVIAAVAAVAHVRSGDIGAIGWLAVGAGVSWAAILIRVVAEASGDPAIGIEPMTVWSLGGAIVLVLLGAGLIAATRGAEDS